jgi:conjugal transfer pilus assembly protein TraA
MNGVMTLESLRVSTYNNTQRFMQTYGTAILTAIVVFAVMMLFSGAAEASTTTATGAGNEFNATANKFDSWIKGGLGKTAALLALGVGLIVAAVKKDWSWLGGGIAVAIVAGVAGSIISASFTAVI